MYRQMSRQMILLDMVGVRGSDLTVLPTALDAPLGAMFANWGRREGFALPHGGGHAILSTTPTAEEDTTDNDLIYQK
jgi:hypothetical protein